MKEIKVRYQGKNYVFEVYSTTINMMNHFFVKAKDKEVKQWLVEDHFFIIASPEPDGDHYLNAIKNTKEEREFKYKIMNEVLTDFFRDMMMAQKSQMN